MSKIMDTNDHVFVKESGIHCRGLFAKRKLRKGTQLAEYIGNKITKEEAVKRMDASLEDLPGSCGEGAVYIMEYDDTYDIDGDVPENIAKYANHSCNPAARFDEVDGKIWIIAQRDIDEGEEITVDYEYALEDSETLQDLEDFRCRCGSPHCVGYMVRHEDRDKLRKLITRSTASALQIHTY